MSEPNERKNARVTSHFTLRLHQLLGQTLAEAERLRRVCAGRGIFEDDPDCNLYRDLTGLIWSAENADALLSGDVMPQLSPEEVIVFVENKAVEAKPRPEARGPEAVSYDLDAHTSPPLGRLLFGLWDLRRGFRALRRCHGKACRCVGCHAARYAPRILRWLAGGVEMATFDLNELRAAYREARRRRG